MTVCLLQHKFSIVLSNQVLQFSVSATSQFIKIDRTIYFSKDEDSLLVSKDNSISDSKFYRLE